MEERLQKILSQCGVCSRRQAEEYLLAGRVQVNGAPAALGDKADLERDQITVDGVVLAAVTEKTYLMLNKPRGYVTTLSDEQGRRTISDLVQDCGRRVWPVGRLDLNSEGLLIMTDDGDLTHSIIHPSHQVEKEYLTWVTGNVDDAIPALSSPMEIDGEHFMPARVRKMKQEGERTLLSIVIHEGKNRQVRRMCAFTGLQVNRLKRVREGALRLDPKLRPGQWRELTTREIALLKNKN